MPMAQMQTAAETSIASDDAERCPRCGVMMGKGFTYSCNGRKCTGCCGIPIITGEGIDLLMREVFKADWVDDEWYYIAELRTGIPWQVIKTGHQGRGKNRNVRNLLTRRTRR